MSLKKLKFPTHTLDTPMGEIVLRGITLPHVRAIFRDNPVEMGLVYETAKKLYATYQQSQNPEDVDLAEVLGVVVQSAPRLVAHLIALSTTEGEPDEDEIKIAEDLPLDVQFDCLMHIARMTFAMEGGARSFFAKAAQLMTPIIKLPNNRVT